MKYRSLYIKRQIKQINISILWITILSVKLYESLIGWLEDSFYLIMNEFISSLMSDGIDDKLEACKIMTFWIFRNCRISINFMSNCRNRKYLILRRLIIQAIVFQKTVEVIILAITLKRCSWTGNVIWYTILCKVITFTFLREGLNCILQVLNRH